MTPQGGHLGWLAGREAPFGAPWTDPLVMDFLELLQDGQIRIPTEISDRNSIERNYFRGEKESNSSFLFNSR